MRRSAAMWITFARLPMYWRKKNAGGNSLRCRKIPGRSNPARKAANHEGACSDSNAARVSIDLSAQKLTLPDGRRLHLHDGPIDLIVEADGPKRNVRAAYEAATRRFASILDELCSELRLLRSQARKNSQRPFRAIAQRMFAAIEPYAEQCFVTPMAAVAGAVAETVLNEMTSAAPLGRAYVNNGGDIALHLASGHSYRIGMVERPDRPSLFASLEISSEDPVRGIATSGWRGRSFSLGIADAVTVLAETAAAADAASRDSQMSHPVCRPTKRPNATLV